MSLERILQILAEDYFETKKRNPQNPLARYMEYGGGGNYFKNLPSTVATLPAHGLTFKANPLRAGSGDALKGVGGTVSESLEDLLGLLRDGTNPSRNKGQLYFAPLDERSFAAKSSAGTGSGSAFRDGPFQLIGRPNAKFKGKLDDLMAVSINHAMPGEARRLIAKEIAKIRPELRVLTYRELAQLEDLVKPVPGSKPKSSSFTKLLKTAGKVLRRG